MFKLNKLVVIWIVITTLIFIGCQDDSSIVEPLQLSDPVEISKITIPAGATVDSAMFYINVTAALSEEVTLHRITGDWEELAVTWNNFGGSFNVDSEGSFTPTNTEWYSTDVTSLVGSWVDSTYQNYGILLKETSPAQFQFYSSREGGMSPYLKVFWTFNGSNGYDSTDALSDAYIRSDQGDTNFGGLSELITGWQDNVQIQTLVRFEIEQVIYNGCTRSFGYWKTHSAYGPAPYDSTWALLGEDSTFFLSEKSFYKVMWTPPRGGNAYYMLAHKYVATNLNILNGADPSAVQDAFDEATVYFDTYTPAYIGSLKGNDSLRQQFIELKNILGQYNGGYIGPGHCDWDVYR